MAINIERTLSQDPIIERYQAEVGATATGMLRTAVLNVSGVREQVLSSEDRVHKECFFRKDASLSSLHFSLHMLLGGNGQTAEVLKSAKQIVEDTWSNGRDISELADADTKVAGLMIDVKGEISSFLDDVLKRDK